MKTMSVKCGKYSVTWFGTGEDVCAPAVYISMLGEEAGKTAVLLNGTEISLVSVDGADWERELSPWPAPKAFKGGKDFSGGAGDYLAVLTGKLFPDAER